MYSRTKLACKFLRYYFTASNGKGHGIHSPFVFDFVTHILKDRRSFYAYTEVESLREDLLRDNTVIEVEDFGAGSAVHKTNLRSIASIARFAAKPKKWGQLLFRMINYYQPQQILELGTSLGLTTAYLAKGNTKAKIITMEGSHAIASKARNNFSWLKLGSVKLKEGNFDNTLLTALEEFSTLDFAFIDGNHRLEPTMRYFEQLLSKINNNSIIILDDIHWSPEMEEAWKNVQQHDAVRLTIDLFFIGIVFFRKEFREKQHFAIRF